MWASMQQPICGKQYLGLDLLALGWPPLRCGTPITTRIPLFLTSAALEGGPNQQSSSTKEIQPYAERVSTRTITLDDRSKINGEY